MHFFLYVPIISIALVLIREKMKILLKVLHKIRFLVYNCIVRLFHKAEHIRSGHYGPDLKSRNLRIQTTYFFTWKRIEVVITSRTRNAVVRKGTWVRIPPLPSITNPRKSMIYAGFLFLFRNCFFITFFFSCVGLGRCFLIFD